MANQQTTVLVNNTALSPWAGNIDSAGYTLGPTAALSLIFRTNNTERMRIASDGKVGIGTASPGNVFAVLASISALRGGSDATIRAQRAGSTNAASIAFSGVTADATIGVNASSDDLCIGWDNGSAFAEKVRVASTGIVRIANLPQYANNAAAITGGLAAGDLYSVTASNPRQVAVVS